MSQTWQMLIEIILFLPFIILLIFLTLKYGGQKVQSMQNGKYMRILDRLPISKENSLLVVKIGEKAYLVASSQGKIEVVNELEDSELKQIETSHSVPQYNDIKDFIKNFNKKGR